MRSENVTMGLKESITLVSLFDFRHVPAGKYHFCFIIGTLTDRDLHHRD